MSSTKTIWKGSTTLITLGKHKYLTDGITGELVTNATVTATVYNETQGTTVGTYNMTLASEQNGRYRGTIPYNVSGIEVGDRCRVKIFADAGSSKRLTIAMKAVVNMRTA